MAIAKIPQDRLRQLREDNGLTQLAVAKRVGCSRSAITYIEAGKRRPGRWLAKRIEVVSSKLGDPISTDEWDEDLGWDDEDFED